MGDPCGPDYVSIVLCFDSQFSEGQLGVKFKPFSKVGLALVCLYSFNFEYPYENLMHEWSSRKLSPPVPKKYRVLHS